MLCRVFYKSRSENNNNLSLPNLCDHSTAGDTSPNLASSPTSEYPFPNPSIHQNIISTSFYHQSPNPSTGYLHMYPEDHDKDHEPRPLTSQQRPVETKCEDDYGFLFDMSLDYSNGVASYLEDVRFDDGCSSVFI